jgi:hypothetical protein
MEKLLASLASDTVKQRAAAVDELEVRGLPRENENSLPFYRPRVQMQK